MAEDQQPSLRSYRLFSAMFAVAALYHLLAAFWPQLGAPSPAWRHAMFVLIDATFALSLLKPPHWLVYPFALLTCQALYSHGWFAWQRDHRLGAISIGVLLVLPAMLFTIACNTWRPGTRPGPSSSASDLLCSGRRAL